MSAPSIGAQPSRTTGTTLADALHDWSEGDPDECIATFRRRRHPDEIHTRHDILERIRREVDGLLARSLVPGDRVVIALPTSIDFMAAFWACQGLGLVAVPAYPTLGPDGTRTLDRFGRIVDVSGAAAVRCDRSLHDDLRARGSDMAWVTPSDRSSGALPRVEVDPEAPALLQFTSGSTAAPRGCEIPNRAVMHNVRTFVDTLGIEPGDRGVNWCPLYHDMGLIASVVLPLAGVGGMIFDPVDFILNPLGWLVALHDEGAALTLAPNFAFALVVRKLERKPPPSLDLSRVRVIINGGEPIDPETLDSFARILAPCGLDAGAMRPAWGMAETTVMATCSRSGPRYDSIDAVATRPGVTPGRWVPDRRARAGS